MCAALITDIPFSALENWRNWSFWKIKRVDGIFRSWILRTCPNKLEKIKSLIFFSSEQNLDLVSAFKRMYDTIFSLLREVLSYSYWYRFSIILHIYRSHIPVSGLYDFIRFLLRKDLSFPNVRWFSCILIIFKSQIRVLAFVKISLSSSLTLVNLTRNDFRL